MFCTGGKGFYRSLQKYLLIGQGACCHICCTTVNTGSRDYLPADTGSRKDMDEQLFQDKLSELMKQISRLPREKRGDMEALAEQTCDRHEKMRKAVSELQESLDHLRLSVKYLIFDLEATRRENKYLREMLNRSQDDEEN